MKPNDNVNISMFEGEVLGVILPDKVTLQVTECEPAVRGDTATNAMKNAVVETGLSGQGAAVHRTGRNDRDQYIRRKILRKSEITTASGKAIGK